jgi:hypothetical protein
MKKLVALILVLGMSSLASADLVVTINGEPQPDAITLFTSDTIELDLDVVPGAIENVLAYNIEFVLSNNQAELIPTDVAFPTPFDLPGSASGGDQRVVVTASQLFSPAHTGPAVLMNGLILHCVDTTDVVLTVTAMNGTTWLPDPSKPLDTLPIEFVHTLRITQIPEPATMALLGLGGLFLRRRRA